MVTTYKKIAVAIDFSEQSNKAFKRAIEVAKNNEASLYLVNVVDTKSFGSISAYDLKYADELKEENLQKINQLQNETIIAGLANIEVSIEAGSPKEILTNLPEVDLLICGATGVSQIEKILLGSVAENIVRYAKYDVLIVR